MVNPLLVALAATEELAPSERPEINSSTFLGLGLMAGAILVIWAIRRLRA